MFMIFVVIEIQIIIPNSLSPSLGPRRSLPSHQEGYFHEEAFGEEHEGYGFEIQTHSY